MTGTRAELLEQAYEMALYIHKHPIKHTPLYYRVRWLAHPAKEAKVQELVQEVEVWLDHFDKEGV